MRCGARWGRYENRQTVPPVASVGDKGCEETQGKDGRRSDGDSADGWTAAARSARHLDKRGHQGRPVRRRHHHHGWRRGARLSCYEPRPAHRADTQPAITFGRTEMTTAILLLLYFLVAMVAL